MSKKLFAVVLRMSVYSNDNDAFIPEHWANESLAILEENMVAGMLIHRDFEMIFAQHGDVVNTRRPAEFVSKRKEQSDSVTIQDARATNVPVTLNQHLHVSFMIYDGEETKAFKDLVNEYIRPAMLAQARVVDQIILGQAYRFMVNGYGHLNGMTSSNAKDYVLGLRNLMNVNKAYVNGRNMLLTPSSETELLKQELFLAADKVGDQGTALREASLGRKLGFDMFMAQNTPSVIVGNTINQTALINKAGGYTTGGISTFVTDGSGAFANGQFITIAGDDTPLRVSSSTGGASPTALVTTTATKNPIADDAVITKYTPGAVNLSGGYAAGWGKEITVDAFTVAPQVGQLVAFGTASPVYTVIGVNGLVGITLDRPLELAIADDVAVNIGPAGNYNFAFHRNALALVTRPLKPPRQGTGAMSAVVNYNGLGIRATITYNGEKQGHLVTLDFLLGIAILDTNLGGLVYG